MDEITKTFWLPLLAAIIAGIIIWYLIAMIKRSRRISREKRVYEFLKKNTTDKAHQQFLSVNILANKLNIAPSILWETVHHSTRIFICPSDLNSIGIYDKVRNVYDERGFLTV